MSLREYRQKRGWTQQQLADRTPGVTRGRIAAWETGARDLGDASFNVDLKLADAKKIYNPLTLLAAPTPPKQRDSE